MENKFLKVVGTTTLAISLITGASSAVLANADTASKEGNKAIEITPYAIKDTLTWDLLGNKTDPTNSFSVTIGAPNIKLYAKNTGAASFRVEVK